MKLTILQTAALKEIRRSGRDAWVDLVRRGTDLQRGGNGLVNKGLAERVGYDYRLTEKGWEAVAELSKESRA